MITIIAKFNVLNGSVDEFKKCAVNVVRDTRKEKGNLAYKIYQSREDATKFTFIEEWLNDTAIEQHNNAKHFLQFLEDIKPLTDGDVQIEQLTKVPSVFCSISFSDALSGIFSSATSIIFNFANLESRFEYSSIAAVKYFSLILPTEITVIFIFSSV